MRSEILKQVQVKLILSVNETNWLKTYLQNPCCDPKDESKEDSDMRLRLFNALPLFEDILSQCPIER